MKTRLIEASNGFNWGKFLLGRFDREWTVETSIEGFGLRGILNSQGWDGLHLLVLDLATGEGALFRPGGLAAADLKKRAVWVCPLFEPFLEWLYQQDLQDLDRLPQFVLLPEAPGSVYGYRRPGERG
jgi:hypothetical protein